MTAKLKLRRQPSYVDNSSNFWTFFFAGPLFSLILDPEENNNVNKYPTILKLLIYLSTYAILFFNAPPKTFLALQELFESRQGLKKLLPSKGHQMVWPTCQGVRRSRRLHWCVGAIAATRCRQDATGRWGQGQVGGQLKKGLEVIGELVPIDFITYLKKIKIMHICDEFHTPHSLSKSIGENTYQTFCSQIKWQSKWATSQNLISASKTFLRLAKYFVPLIFCVYCPQNENWLCRIY